MDSPDGAANVAEKEGVLEFLLHGKVDLFEAQWWSGQACIALERTFLGGSPAGQVVDAARGRREMRSAFAMPAALGVVTGRHDVVVWRGAGKGVLGACSGVPDEGSGGEEMEWTSRGSIQSPTARSWGFSRRTIHQHVSTSSWSEGALFVNSTTERLLCLAAGSDIAFIKLKNTSQIHKAHCSVSPVLVLSIPLADLCFTKWPCTTWIEKTSVTHGVLSTV